MLRAVAERKRPEGRKNPRVTIEVYDQDRELWKQARLAAVQEGTTLRELVQKAVRQYLEHGDADLPPAA